MKKLSILFMPLLVITTLILAGCANLTSSNDSSSNTVSHTVAFDANGGTAVASQTVEDGKLATEPSTTNGSHNLIGWYNNAAKYDFTSKVTTDLALIAKWTTTVESKVEFDSTWNLDVNGTTYPQVGYVVLDCTVKTFENYSVLKGVATLKYSGTYSMTDSSITCTITFDSTNTGSNSKVGSSTEYTISGDTWTYSAVPALYGFGNKTVAATTVTKKVLETIEE
jgi:hypothetical protein